MTETKRAEMIRLIETFQTLRQERKTLRLDAMRRFVDDIHIFVSRIGDNLKRLFHRMMDQGDTGKSDTINIFHSSLLRLWYLFTFTRCKSPRNDEIGYSVKHDQLNLPD